MNTMFLFFQDSSGGSIFSTIFLIAPIALIFYFLVLRPQKQQQEKLKDMIGILKAGDEVVTNGGIIGKIKEVRDTSFIVMSADKSMLEIAKSAVVGRKPE
jgi:preprotein translocase subunit YajC